MSEASAAECITMWRGSGSSLPRLVHHFLPTCLGGSRHMEKDTHKDKRKIPNPIPIHRLFFRCNQITCVRMDRMAESTTRTNFFAPRDNNNCNIIISYGYVGVAIAHHLFFLISVMCHHFTIGWLEILPPSNEP